MTQLNQLSNNQRKSAESKRSPGRKPGTPSARVRKLIDYGYWWWTLPGLAAILYVHYISNFIGGFFAFTDYSGIGDFDFIGFENFVYLFQDLEVTGTIWNTIFLAVGSMVLQNALGLGLALLINRGLKTRYILRTLLFLPVVLSSISISYVFNFIFSYDGPVNSILLDLGILKEPISFLADTNFAIYLILYVIVWHGTGFAMVIYLAGLATVPSELEEAAAIDGAGVFRRFFRVTIPMIQPSLAVATTLGLIQGMKVFDQVLAMTGGGPVGATETLGLKIYQDVFVNLDFGYGSAIALVFTVLILIAAAIQQWATRDRSGVHA